MISKRRIILFFLVLAVMLLVKYAVSQTVAQGQVGWDYLSDAGSSEDDVYGFAIAVIAFGTFLGAIRSWSRNYSFSHGNDFEPGIIRLHLS